MCEHQSAQLLAVLQHVGEIGDDRADAQIVRAGEQNSSVDEDHVVARLQRQHVHAEFAESAERNNSQFTSQGASCRETQPITAIPSA